MSLEDFGGALEQVIPQSPTISAISMLTVAGRPVRLPDSGHFAPWQSPDKVAEALAGFL